MNIKGKSSSDNDQYIIYGKILDDSKEKEKIQILKYY